MSDHPAVPADFDPFEPSDIGFSMLIAVNRYGLAVTPAHLEGVTAAAFGRPATKGIARLRSVRFGFLVAARDVGWPLPDADARYRAVEEAAAQIFRLRGRVLSPADPDHRVRVAEDWFHTRPADIGVIDPDDMLRAFREHNALLIEPAHRQQVVAADDLDRVGTFVARAMSLERANPPPRVPDPPKYDPILRRLEAAGWRFDLRSNADRVHDLLVAFSDEGWPPAIDDPWEDRNTTARETTKTMRETGMLADPACPVVIEPNRKGTGLRWHWKESP